METLKEYKTRIARAGGIARWSGKSENDKSRIMSDIRKKGLLNKQKKYEKQKDSE